MSSSGVKFRARQRRQRRVRRKVWGTSDRPRLSVFRSLNHIYAQLIDDTKNCVLTSASSRSKDFQVTGKSGGNVDGAVLVGEMIGEKALQLGIQQVVFDRNGYIYHGRVKAVAAGARNKGLAF